MKRLIIIICCFCIISSLKAQKGRYDPSAFDSYREGYIVKANYDTLQGEVYISEPHYMEYSIDFRTSSSGDPSIFRPGDLISYATKDVLGNDILWISTNYSALDHPPEDSYAGKMEQAFLNTVVNGPISLYGYYNFKEDAQPQKTTTQYMQLPDGQIVDVSGMLLGFAKKMPEFVADYPDLANKISKKEKGYKFGNLNDVAREYNEWYVTNHPDYGFITVKASAKSTNSLPDEIKFNSQPITFTEAPGVEFWLSDPFKRYEKWDTQKTGNAKLAVAIKVRNKGGKAISKINPSVTVYDKNGGIMKQYTGGTAPMGFEPNPGNTWPDNYEGIYDAFYSDELSRAADFGKIEFKLADVVYASAAATDQPVFKNDWVEFDNYKGYKFRVSEPFVFVDDLSGNNRFGIALEFKNESGKEAKFFNFQIKVYDDQGIYFDEERQNHNQMFEPGINPMKTGFPVDYQGVNRKFYTNEEDFMKVFKNIEFSLNSVEL